MDDRPTLLMLGSMNHPHVEHLALAMRERGFDVLVAGDEVSSLPPSILPAEGVPTFPAPRLKRGSARGAVAHVRWIRRLLRELRPDNGASAAAGWLTEVARGAGGRGEKAEEQGLRRSAKRRRPRGYRLRC